MAVCSACDQEMLEADTCLVLQFDDEDKPRIPYDPELLGPWPDMPPDHRCHDCGIKPGGIHHLFAIWRYVLLAKLGRRSVATAGYSEIPNALVFPSAVWIRTTSSGSW